MSSENLPPVDRKMTNVFERYLTVWVGLCIFGGILLGKVAPDLAGKLDRMAIEVNGAPVVSIPIAICLFFMMYPIMVKIDFASVIKAGKSGKPVLLTLILNWAIKPFTMYDRCYQTTTSKRVNVTVLPNGRVLRVNSSGSGSSQRSVDCPTNVTDK